MVLIHYAKELSSVHPNTTIVQVMEDTVFQGKFDLNIAHSNQMGMLIDCDIQLWHITNREILLDGKSSSH